MEVPYGWQDLSREKLLQIIERLRALETMTWSDILVKGKKDNHEIPFGDLVRPAQACLKQVWQGGVDSVVSLRLTARERIFGIMDDGVLHLIWWDPEHEVCPSTYMDRRS